MINNMLAPLQNMLYIYNFYKRIILKKMNNIISLQWGGNFLEVHQNKILHITISDQQYRAKDILENLLKINNRNHICGLVEDNVSKIQINNVSILSLINNQDEHTKIDIFKQLLSLIEGMLLHSQSQNINPDSILYEGFFYYQHVHREIRYYKYKQHNIIQKKKSKYTPIYIAGLFLYFLLYSRDFKQYLKNWKKISISKQQFIPDASKFKKNNQIDNFIKSIFFNEVNTIKMGIHTIQIIKQKLNWIKGTSQQSIKKSTNYSDLKLDLKPTTKQIQYGSRLKHSNSMINLSSSTHKNRKYKKMTQHHRNEKLFKPQNSKYKTTESFYNSSSFLMKKNVNSSLLGEVTKIVENELKYYQDERHGQSKIPKQFQNFSALSQLNDGMIQRCNENQLDLIKLLERRQKNRKFQSKNSQNKQNINIPSQLQQNSQFRRKKNKFSIIKTIDVSIKSEKSKKSLKFVSTLYSISEKLYHPSNLSATVSVQNIYGSKQIQNKIKNLKEEKIFSDVQQSTLLQQQKKSFFDINLKFLCQTVQIFYKQVNLRSFLLYPLYAIYVFYFFLLYRNKYKMDQHESTHLVNIDKVGALITKQLTKTQNNKVQSKQTISSIQFLLKVTTNSEITLLETRQTSLKVLQSEFQRNKVQFLKRKSQLMKNKTLKTLLICLLRNAISISIIKNYQHCAIASDFPRYQNVIIGKSEYEIDLLTELRNFQQIFQ